MNGKAPVLAAGVHEKGIPLQPLKKILLLKKK
jgi:hypothetical protein